METAIDTTVFAALALFATAAIARLAWNIGRSRSPRRGLRRRLGRLPLGAVLNRLGGDPRHYLFRTPAAEIDERLRACAACADVAHCKRLLSSRCEASAFAFCPNFTSLRAAAAAYECGRNPHFGAESALPPPTARQRVP